MIALNTMYLNSQNTHDLAAGEKQLQWLKTELESAAKSEPERKFILTMHIYPGVYSFYNIHTDFMFEKQEFELLQIVNEH